MKKQKKIAFEQLHSKNQVIILHDKTLLQLASGIKICISFFHFYTSLVSVIHYLKSYKSSFDTTPIKSKGLE